MIELDGNMYAVIEDVKEGFQEDVLNERYSEILRKYDFIVGDWGYDQLRLKGFYKNDNRKASFESRIGLLDDYLYEYCNFGCAYFVLEKQPKKQVPKETVREAPVEEMKNEKQVEALEESTER